MQLSTITETSQVPILLKAVTVSWPRKGDGPSSFYNYGAQKDTAAVPKPEILQGAPQFLELSTTLR
jgi:hypothetical protein